MRKLLIVSGSSRIKKEPQQPIPALQRFRGGFLGVIKNALARYGKLKNIDVLILSPVYGLIQINEKIPYRTPIAGTWYKIGLTEKQIDQQQKQNMAVLEKILKKQKYDEIYVNVGKNMLQLLGDFKKIVPGETKVTFCQGRGIGPKMVHMKNWIEEHGTRYARAQGHGMD